MKRLKWKIFLKEDRKSKQNNYSLLIRLNHDMHASKETGSVKIVSGTFKYFQQCAYGIWIAKIWSCVSSYPFYCRVSKTLVSSHWVRNISEDRCDCHILIFWSEKKVYFVAIFSASGYRKTAVQKSSIIEVDRLIPISSSWKSSSCIASCSCKKAYLQEVSSLIEFYFFSPTFWHMFYWQRCIMRPRKFQF